MRKVSRLLVIAVLSCLHPAWAACDLPAEGSHDYERAMRTVDKLPEVRKWAKTHPFPVAYRPSTDRQELLGRDCFWSVAVYADRPERFELFHVFYVMVRGRRILVKNYDGESISIVGWRAKGK